MEDSRWLILRHLGREAYINNSNTHKAGMVNIMGEWNERFTSSDSGLFFLSFSLYSMARQSYKIA